ncbi:MAG: hypothetical protein JKY93_12285 [Gammaproteobacteria bacterium]|nr:hypothetical protein [Gammaproteobacteria bacterium]
MFRKDKYYIAKGAEAIAAADSFRKDYIAWKSEAGEILASYGATGGNIGWGGKFHSLKFEEGKVPPDFKKMDKHGCHSPYVRNKEWMEKLENIPVEPQPIDYIQKAFNVPLQVKYEGEGSQGCMCTSSSLNPISVCYFSDTSPLLIILPDVLGVVKDQEEKGYTVTEPKDWSVPIGFKEILREEWEFMVAKSKQKEAA